MIIFAVQLIYLIKRYAFSMSCRCFKSHFLIENTHQLCFFPAAMHGQLFFLFGDHREQILRGSSRGLIARDWHFFIKAVCYTLQCDKKGVLLFPHLLLRITNVFPKSFLPFCNDPEIVSTLESVSSMSSFFLGLLRCLHCSYREVWSEIEEIFPSPRFV